MRRVVIFCIIVSLLLIVGCTENGEKGAPDQPAQLANPSAVYCDEQGFIYDIRDTEAGQVGYCVFLDASECLGWDYFCKCVEDVNAFCSPVMIERASQCAYPCE